MKKFFLVGYFLFIVTLCHAQGAYGRRGGEREVFYGVKGGIDVSWLSKIIQQKGVIPFIGPVVGGIVEFRLNDKLALGSELYWVRMGYQIDTTDERNLYDYLNVSFMLKGYKGGWRGYAGPEIGLLLDAKKIVGGVKVSRKDITPPLNFQLAAGGGYQFDSGINLDMRLSLGLSNLINGEGIATQNKEEAGETDVPVIPNAPPYRSFMVSFSVGYYFGYY